MLVSSNYLTESLKKVNDELQSSIDFEMKRLKEEEKKLKEMLLLKTRRDLLSTMEKELEMDSLANSNANLATKNALLNSTNNLNESIKYSDGALTKSHLLFSKLNDQHLAATASSLNKSNDLLRQYLMSTNLSNQIEQPAEVIRPNVVFTSKENIKSMRTFLKRNDGLRKSKELKASSQDLNKQQTLKENDDFIRNFIRFNNINQTIKRNKSAANLAANQTSSNQRYNNYNSLINSFPGYSTISQQDLNKLRNSLNLTNSTNKYMKLPMSKTVVHSKPWSPGKVETIYYPYRDTKLNRSASHKNVAFD